MSDREPTQIDQLTEPRSYPEIVKEQVLENTHILFLAAGLIFGFITLLTAAALIHIHIAEVPIFAQGEQMSETDLAGRPIWGYYLNLCIYGIGAAAGFRGYLLRRGEPDA